MLPFSYIVQKKARRAGRGEAYKTCMYGLFTLLASRCIDVARNHLLRELHSYPTLCPLAYSPPLSDYLARLRGTIPGLLRFHLSRWLLGI